MHLVRSIFFSAATHHYTVLVTHIAGTNNSITDSLSRLQITLFRRLAPTADVEPTPVPKSALTLWHIHSPSYTLRRSPIPPTIHTKQEFVDTLPSAPPRDDNAFQPQRPLCGSLLPILPTKSALKPSSSTWQVSVSLTLRTACQTPSRRHHFFISSCGESSAQWASLHVSALPLPCPSFGRLRRS